MEQEIIQIIKYEGDNQTFIWKHPTEDFFTGTQLVVHESQEAVFFLNGQALDSFGPGRHTLTSQNMPIVGKFFNRSTGDKTPFHCEIYFINKTEQMAIKWGTDTKMEYVEPTYGFPIQLGACGEMNFRVSDGRKLLIKIVGTERGMTQSSMVAKLRAFLMTKLKPYLTSFIRGNAISIFQIDEHLQTISEAMQSALAPDFSDYGLALERFFVTTIIKPEDDKNYRRFKDLHYRQYVDVAEAKLRQQIGVIDQQTAAQKMVIEAQGLAQKRALEGYTYAQERGFDVAERMAANEAIGQFANMGIGLGMISGVGGAVGNSVGNVMNTAMSAAFPQAQNSVPASGVPAATRKEATSPDVANQNLPNTNFQQATSGDVASPRAENSVPANSVPAKPKFCMNCGAKLPANAKFCSECGTKL